MPIDFEQASQAWRQNKIHKGNGYFVYRCSYIHSDGKSCKRPSIHSSLHACKKHQHRIRENQYR